MITTPYRWKTRFGALAGFLALTSLAGPSFSATAGSNLIDLKIDNGSTGNNSSVYINQQGVENVIGNDGRFAAFSPTGGTLTGASNLASNKIAFTVTLQQASFSAGTVVMARQARAAMVAMSPLQRRKSSPARERARWPPHLPAR